jgi:hypothetical protein
MRRLLQFEGEDAIIDAATEGEDDLSEQPISDPPAPNN